VRKIATKKWVSIALALGIIISTHFGVAATPVAQIDSSKDEKRTTIPAPLQGQKKVVLKNLGMA
jgi:hypothetical protein